ncbi:MAG: tRNA guanosine(34) transglycosylase Tgt [Deltaproteobacteria bacterium]|jgi:queuine tRNA-ribosyltransferase/7-cyano-7-deazaguanine tRNA-ribosyltransferase
MFSFKLLAEDQQARAGKLVTPHGTVETPSFVAVGTQATVKAMSAEDLRAIGSQIIITNAYHLHLQPGAELVEKMGGLHRFMGWHGPLMIDSGGFQIFSQGAAREHGVGKIASIFPEEKDRGGHFTSKTAKPLVRVNANGVEFVSYLDGSQHRFTPEGVVDIGRRFGADIILVLDECTSPLHDYEYTRTAMERTHRWAVRAMSQFRAASDRSQALWGIVQGGAYQDLREQSVAFVAEQNFDGYAVGGSLGRSKDEMHQVLDWTIPFLPQDKARHLLGVGEIDDIFEIVRRGVDLFDCVAPTRMARTGTLFVEGEERFRIHIPNARFKDDPGPVDEKCTCYTCSNYSRAYLRHLFVARELSAIRLATIHNLSFIESLMGQIRHAIKERSFSDLRRRWLGTSGGYG